MTFGPLVDAAWLRTHSGEPDVRVIDFRWYLQGRNGRAEYEKGHIPGAVFVDLDAVTGEGAGRHPLPTAEQFQAEMRRAGVSGTTRVVAYDDETVAPTASRLWFLLGYFGHRAQAVLDGGIGAWGKPLETAAPRVRPGDFRAATGDASRVLHYEDVRALRGVPLVDARVQPRFRGETEPIDPKAGHIPGAVNHPFTENLAPDGRFKPASELRRQFESLGAGDGAVFYCGSGVNATQELLAMEIAGLPGARLYAGSWSDWSNRDAPVATGADPG